MDASLRDINKEFDIFANQALANSEFNTQRVKKAFEFAKKAHAFQRRKSGEPYINHPFEVARIVHSLGLDEVSLISALLHDVVEDTQVSLKEIEKEFGEEVTKIVDGLTKIGHFGENKAEKNIQALRKILLASAKDIRILIIKLCDRLHNLRTLEDMPAEKRTRIAKETIQIYVPIAQKTGLYSLKWELEDLAFKYIDYDMYKFIKEKVMLKREEREEIVKKAVKEIKETLELAGAKDFIAIGRPKNFYSIYKKIKGKAKSFEDIFDLYAIRVITKSVADCYLILGNLHDQFQVFPNRLKDYIANPKANGYQALHTVIYSRDIKTPVEVQIRTEEMNVLAEFGVAAHWKYKNIQEDKKFEKKISWLREVLEWEKEHKDNQEFLNLLKFDFFEDEIFVFTPKNDVITLPENSSVLDFAYAIHTDIGRQAFKAKVNGSITTIDTKLKSGDIVQIITSPSAKPTEKWLKIVNTSKARIKIRDDLDLKLDNKRNEEENEITFQMLKEKITRIDEFKKVRAGGCCSFSYSDNIVGVIKKDKELVIHHNECENAKYTVNKKIPLSWKQEKNKEVTLYIYFKDRYGFVMDMLNILAEFNVHVTKLNTKISKDGNVKMDLQIHEGDHIDLMVEQLKKLESLTSIRVYRGLFS